MIKTKTPRHWGGGIRQVSPPMLTSRLSNKRGGRTNGWKDYSRSRRNREWFWICEDGSSYFPLQQFFRNFTHRLYSKNCIRLGKRKWRICNQTSHFFKKRFTKSVKHPRHFVVRRFYKFRGKFSGRNSSCSRLTLKGVA